MMYSAEAVRGFDENRVEKSKIAGRHLTDAGVCCLMVAHGDCGGRFTIISIFMD